MTDADLRSVFDQVVAPLAPDLSFDQWVQSEGLDPAGNLTDEALGEIAARFHQELAKRADRRPDITHLHLKYGLVGTMLRRKRFGQKRRLRKIDGFLAVTFQVAGETEQQVIGVLGTSGSSDPLGGLVGLFEEINVLHWREAWPRPIKTLGATVMVTDGTEAVGIPVDAELLEILSNSFHADAWINFTLLSMIAPPASDLAHSLYPKFGDADRRRVMVDCLRGPLGANMLLTWLCNDYNIDKWYEESHNSSLLKAHDSFVNRVESKIHEMEGGDPTSRDVINSVVEMIQRVQDPLGRIALGDALSKELMPAVYEQMMADAAEFREGGGTWREIGEELDVTTQAAQKRLDPAARQRNVDESRRRRAR